MMMLEHILVRNGILLSKIPITLEVDKHEVEPILIRINPGVILGHLYAYGLYHESSNKEIVSYVQQKYAKLWKQARSGEISRLHSKFLMMFNFIELSGG